MPEGKASSPFKKTEGLADKVFEDLFPPDVPPVKPLMPDAAVISAAPATLDTAVAAAAVSGDSKPPDAAVGAGLSPEALERQQRAFADLQQQADHWRGLITGVNNKQELDEVTRRAAVNGKYTVDMGPGFVVGKTFRDVLMKNPGIQSDAEKDFVRARAWELQGELRALYLAKRAEIYPPRVDTKATTATPAAVPAVASAPATAPREPQVSHTTAGTNLPAAAVVPAAATPSMPKAPDAAPVTVPDAQVQNPFRILKELPRNPWEGERTFRDAQGNILVIRHETGKGYHVQLNGVGSYDRQSRTWINDHIKGKGYMRIDDRPSVPTAVGSPAPAPDVAATPGATPAVEDAPAHEDIPKVGDAWEKVISFGGNDAHVWLIIQSIDSDGTVTVIDRRQNQGRPPFENTYQTSLDLFRDKIRAEGGFTPTEPVIIAKLTGADPAGEPGVGDAPRDAHAFRDPEVGYVYTYHEKSGDEARVHVSGTVGAYTYTVTRANGFSTTDLEGLKRQAAENDWSLAKIEKGSDGTPEGGTEGAPDKPAHVDNAHIAKLRDELDIARQAFIEAEETQSSTWKNLSRVLRLSRRDSDDDEVEEFQQQYDAGVRALVDAELEQLKQSGMSGRELRQEMAGMIREYEFEEAERIYDLRREMRLKKEKKEPLLQKMKALWEETAPHLSPRGGATYGEMWKARMKLLVEGTAIAGKGALRAFEKTGELWTKANRSKWGKYILTATIAGAGAVALGAATGPVGTVMVGSLVMRRLAGGAALAVGIEGGLELNAARRREKKKKNIEKDHEDIFGKEEKELSPESIELQKLLGEDIELEENEAENFAKFEEFLKEQAKQIRRGEGARRRAEGWKKFGAIAIGIGAGSGAAAYLLAKTGLLSHIGGKVAQAAAIPKGAAGSGGVVFSGAPVPEAGASSPASAASGQMSPEESMASSATPPSAAASAAETVAARPAAVATPESPQDTRTSLRSPVVPIEASTKELLGTHRVDRGDSIWKIAEEAVEKIPDMDERASSRFAKLVELKLQEKLSVIDPSAAKAAGFTPDAEGKFSPHRIQAGATLELGKLITPAEMAEMIEKAQSDTMIATPTTEDVVRPTVTAVKEISLEDRVPSVASPEEKAKITALFAEDSKAGTTAAIETAAPNGVDLLRPGGNVVAYVETLPREEQLKLLRNFKKLSMEILQTSAVMGGEVPESAFDPALHPELLKTPMAAILDDHRTLSSSPLTNYDRARNPLHWSQMEEIAKFSKATTKAFSAEFARPRVGETLQEYTLRMAALASNMGKKIPGFRMLD